MFVRTASPRDIPAIRALLVETWHATYDAIYGKDRVTAITGDIYSSQALGDWQTRPHSEFLVADDGSLIGGVAFATTDDGGKTLLLHQLYVAPACQGRGIGGLLLDEVEGCFPDAVTVRLEVEARNARAIAFYLAQGFSEVAKTDKDAGGGSTEPALIFERPIIWAD
jgi:ribosomal protein S18 acetylase RimI-like enzyme